MSAPARPGLRYRPELDGLRGVAVLSVLLYHLSFVVPALRPIARGGYLGVDLFFVLSGMLITELIVSDQTRHAGAAFGMFYQRRARRLLPTLFVFLVAAPVYFQLISNQGLATLHVYKSVFDFVDFGKLTYPWTVGISQIWTLVVEWEFYLIWPVLLMIGLWRGFSYRTLGVVALTVGFLTTVVRAIVYYRSGHDFGLNYYNGWLRFDDLLVGCAVGLFGEWPKIPNWLRWVAAALILVAVMRVRDSWAFLYVGGIFLFAVMAAIVVAPRTRPWGLDRALSWRPMIWVGRISYSLYLWSGTAIAEVAAHGRSWPTSVRLVVGVAASFGLAIPSYYLIEKQFRMPSRRPLTTDTDPPASGSATGDRPQPLRAGRR